MGEFSELKSFSLPLSQINSYADAHASRDERFNHGNRCNQREEDCSDPDAFEHRARLEEGIDPASVNQAAIHPTRARRAGVAIANSSELESHRGVPPNPPRVQGATT